MSSPDSRPMAGGIPVSGMPGRCGIAAGFFAWISCWSEDDVSLIVSACAHEHMSMAWACARHRKEVASLICSDCKGVGGGRPLADELCHDCPVTIRPATEEERLAATAAQLSWQRQIAKGES